MQDLQDEIEELRQKAKSEMEETDERSQYFEKSGRHAAYKEVLKILERREQEIEQSLYSDEVREMVETERPLPDMTEGVDDERVD